MFGMVSNFPLACSCPLYEYGWNINVGYKWK
jgi:hypothetical protein